MESTPKFDKRHAINLDASDDELVLGSWLQNLTDSTIMGLSTMLMVGMVTHARMHRVYFPGQSHLS
jgi:hypothetical protein